MTQDMPRGAECRITVLRQRRAGTLLAKQDAASRASAARDRWDTLWISSHRHTPPTMVINCGAVKVPRGRISQTVGTVTMPWESKPPERKNGTGTETSYRVISLRQSSFAYQLWTRSAFSSIQRRAESRGERRSTFTIRSIFVTASIERRMFDKSPIVLAGSFSRSER